MSDLIEKENTQIAEAKTVTPMSMLQMAIEKGAGLEQMQQLMDLQERWEANEAKKAYTKAMSDFRAKCPEIEKTRRVSFDTQKGRTEYNHAGLPETIEQIKDLLAECGLSHSWRTNQDNGLVTVTCCVTHVLGHQECTSLSGSPDSSGGKNNIQAIGSTISYLERYTLFAILGMASKEMDNDGNIPDVCISINQALDLEALAEEVGANKAGFLKYLKVNSFEELPARKYEGAVKALEAKRKK